MSGQSGRWRGTALPTTRTGVERAFSYFTAGVRLGTVAQMVPAVGEGVGRSPRPDAYLACWLAAALAAVAVSAVTLVRRRPLGTAASTADYALACLLLVLAPLVLAGEERVGTWVAFQPAYALSVIITASGVRSLALWSGGLLGVVGSYLIYIGDAGLHSVTTTIGNELTFVVYALVARFFFGYTRRIADDADASRALAAELARREEERRAQLAMHNGVAVMRLLATPDPATARSGLLDLAEVELRRMRSYLRGDNAGAATRAAGDEVALAALVRQTCDRFPDLHIDTLLDLGAGVRLPAPDAEAVERALESLLLNVRVHAGADGVVVHLDQDDDGRWTLTVSDDGSGFDPAAATSGIGLREVVVGELRRRGLDVDVTSAAGEGTTVTISGRRRTAVTGPAGSTR